MAMQRMVLALGVLFALTAGAAAAEDAPKLTADQQQTLDKLRKDMWDQGYSDKEIQDALKDKTDEMLGRTGGSSGSGNRGPSPKDPDQARLFGFIQDLQDKGILPPDDADYARKQVGQGLTQDKLRDLAKWRWAQKMVRERVDKGETPPQAMQEVRQFMDGEKDSVIRAWQDLREDGKADPEQCRAKLRSQFPDVPQVLIEGLGSGGEPPPDMRLPPDGPEDNFSDDELDEIVDDLMESEFGGN